MSNTNNTTRDYRCAWCTQVTWPGYRMRCEACYRVYCYQEIRYKGEEECSALISIRTTASPHYTYVCRDCAEQHE